MYVSICIQNMTNEKEILRINHPYVMRMYQNSLDMGKDEYKKLNFILYSHKTTSPAYWDQHFELVNKKYCFKPQYYKDFEIDHEIGKCLHYDTIEAHVYVIIINEYITNHFSYQNLEKGLAKIKSITKSNQWYPTFVIQSVNSKKFETFINRKIASLISSSFVELDPCRIIEITTSNTKLLLKTKHK